MKPEPQARPVSHRRRDGREPLRVRTMWWWWWQTKRTGRSRRLPDIFFLPAQFVAWAAIVVTIAKALPFVKNYVPAEWGLTDGIVALLAIVVLATVHVRKDLKADTTRILEKLEGPEFRRFATSEEQIFFIPPHSNKAGETSWDVTCGG